MPHKDISERNRERVIVSPQGGYSGFYVHFCLHSALFALYKRQRCPEDILRHGGSVFALHTKPCLRIPARGILQVFTFISVFTETKQRRIQGVPPLEKPRGTAGNGAIQTQRKPDGLFPTREESAFNNAAQDKPNAHRYKQLCARLFSAQTYTTAQHIRFVCTPESPLHAAFPLCNSEYGNASASQGFSRDGVP